MNKWILAAYVLAAGVGAAQAAGVCNSEIEKTKDQWQSIRLEPGSKPSSISKGIPAHHEHIQAAVDSMRIHLKIAEELCQEGMDHESLLHLDVVRAFLHLPEIQHRTAICSNVNKENHSDVNRSRSAMFERATLAC